MPNALKVRVQVFDEVECVHIGFIDSWDCARPASSRTPAIKNMSSSEQCHERERLKSSTKEAKGPKPRCESRVSKWDGSGWKSRWRERKREREKKLRTQ